MNDTKIPTKPLISVLSATHRNSESVGDLFIFLPMDRKSRSANNYCFCPEAEKKTCIKFHGSVRKWETGLFFTPDAN